ncbi:MAG: alpha-amylase [Eubacterium sp.]|nr:alpha-amylase [Eubacterium sp.]
MAWYDEAVFYHIYPLGLTGAPKQNDYGEPVHRLKKLIPWIDHMKEIGCNALYIGPLFESASHGYDTTDYRRLDGRLGDNEDLKDFVARCHKAGIHVIFDGVFNHTGRDFFAFRDIQKNREHSPYTGWYCNVNFGGNNEYNDGFSYDNWGGYNLLVKLNQRNPEVQNYICDTIRFWVKEFDVDGIRLDAADVLDFDFMKCLRRTANEVKPDFWLMGEVIHGDYTRWVNPEMLHAVTNYSLHKALYSGHNEHNYFEIAHTVRRLYEMGGNRPEGLRLYNFVDNHDVERIYTKLQNKAHMYPVHILLYTLPGIPSIYYGSEFGIEGKKEWGSDASLRPELHLEDYRDAVRTNPITREIAALGKIRQSEKALSYGIYRELLLTNRQYAFAREWKGEIVLVTVNNDDNDYTMTISAEGVDRFTGALQGGTVRAQNGQITVTVRANSGEIWVSDGRGDAEIPVADQSSEAAESGPAGAAEAATGSATGEAEGTASEPATGEAEGTASEPAAGEAEGTASSPADGEGEDKVSGASDAANISDAEAASGSPETDVPWDKPYEEMSVAELQAAILAKLAANGPVTDQMRRDVRENIWHDSLVNWVKSFR